MEQRQMALRVEIDPSRVEQELRKAARKVSNQYRIPGFRKGKAPYNLLVQYVGLPALFQEFIEPLGQEIYPQALEEAKIEPYAPGVLDVESLEPLTYKFIVPLEPEIDLGDYRSLRVEEPQAEVTDEEVDAQLAENRARFSSYGEVDRPSQYGDLITIDVKSVIPPSEEGGEEFVVLDESDWDVTPDEENPMDPPGFDEALLGLRPGEEKDFTLSWPVDSQSMHAGKEAKFHVKVHKIQATTEPALDDSFAQMVGPEFQTLDELKDNIRTTLLEEKKRESENDYVEKALDALMAQSTMNYPPTVVEDQLDTMVNSLERQLRDYGIGDIEQYLQQIGQTVEQYRDSMRPQAEIMAKRNLLISEIFRQEGITVSDEDIEKRVDAMMGAQTGESADSDTVRALRDMLLSGSGRAVLESQILQENSIQRLLAIVRGDELPERPTPQAASEASEAPAEASATGENAADETASIESDEKAEEAEADETAA
jgi:trigger factor